jgi:hypothetical protein
MKALIGLITALALANAHAADKADKMDWKACDKEIKEFKCSGDDKAIWSCLEKHDDKHSPACAKVHEQGDAKFKK